MIRAAAASGRGLLLLAVLACAEEVDPGESSERAGWGLEPLEDGSGLALVYGPLGLSPADAAPNSHSPETELVSVWTGEVEARGGTCVHSEGLPPVLGRVEIFERDAADGAVSDGGGVESWIRFVPRFAFVSERRYTACLGGRIAAEEGARRFSFTPQADVRPVAPPRVESVWPPEGPVPANLLRFYLTFSEPMWSRGVSGLVALLGESGHEIPDAFVDLPEGLWDRAGRRLTLVVHPGRIKRGVGPRRVMGPVLEEGSAITLRVDGALRSRRGVALGEEVELEYRVGAADRESPDPASWRLEAPAAPQAPARVVFDERLDRPQLRGAVHVVDEAGRAVEGRVDVAKDGRIWSFLPAEPWRTGRYRILVRRAVEDLAGNTPLGVFDRELDSADEGAAGAASGESTAVELVFRVGGG